MTTSYTATELIKIYNRWMFDNWAAGENEPLHGGSAFEFLKHLTDLERPVIQVLGSCAKHEWIRQGFASLGADNAIRWGHWLCAYCGVSKGTTGTGV